MFGNQNLDLRNQLLAKHLQTIVPFVSDVGLKDLLKLRHREEGAFIRFRGALSEALKEATPGGPRFTDRTAHDLYADVVAPRLRNSINE